MKVPQVGSKNAAFYIGRSVKVTTKRVEAHMVHELRLEASALEQRYKEGQVNCSLYFESSVCWVCLDSRLCSGASPLQ